ncbi:hypothetical protein LWI29_035614 [Acer saccharum]|uniref:Uncharacterized protein n=1 Tax=Acer saccharum TaxID=4024 RepID=A0AA39RPA4_ACESA|nr:hypothetical protein LWI29_035614 [Acer saccharum]
MELLCVVLWRLWYWRNQQVHSTSRIRNEDVFAWASDYIGEFRLANLVERSSAGVPRPVAKIRSGFLLHRTRSFNGRKCEEVVKIGGDSSLHSLQRPSVNNPVVGGGGGGGGMWVQVWMRINS